MEEKTPLLAQVVWFQMLDFESSAEVSNQFKYLSEKLLLSQNYVTSEGAVSHNVLYYQQLTIARYPVSFYANNYFE